MEEALNTETLQVWEKQMLLNIQCSPQLPLCAKSALTSEETKPLWLQCPDSPCGDVFLFFFLSSCVNTLNSKSNETHRARSHSSPFLSPETIWYIKFSRGRTGNNPNDLKFGLGNLCLNLLIENTHTPLLVSFTLRIMYVTGHWKKHDIKQIYAKNKMKNYTKRDEWKLHKPFMKFNTRVLYCQIFQPQHTPQKPTFRGNWKLSAPSEKETHKTTMHMSEFLKCVQWWQGRELVKGWQTFWLFPFLTHNDHLQQHRGRKNNQ